MLARHHVPKRASCIADAAELDVAAGSLHAPAVGHFVAVPPTEPRSGALRSVLARAHKPHCLSVGDRISNEQKYSHFRPLPLLAVGDNRARESDAGEAFSRHGGKVFRYLLRRIGNPDDAEELTQRVFTDITAALARGERPDSMLAWLYAVAERRFTDELRRRARAADVSQRAFVDAQSREPSEYGAAVATALREEIERLPVEQGRVVVIEGE